MPDSLWIATTPATDYPGLDGDAHADVAVVGGGMSGIVTAVRAAESGANVVLLERARIAAGVSGYTTAKLTSQHGLRYADLARNPGERVARLYGEANEAAITWVAGSGIDCDLRRAPAYVWAETADELERVRGEAAAAAKLGLPASFATEVPLAVSARGAVRFDEQALIHPRKLLLALAERFVSSGGRLHEQTAVLDLHEGEPCRLETTRGTVTARAVVLATNMPIADRGLYFARAFPYRGYAIAARIAPENAPDGMFINAGSPTRSVRPAMNEDAEPLLLVGGEGHKAGAETDTQRRWGTLEEWARERLAVGEVTHRWSTQDAYPADGRPFVGRLHPASRHVFVATGFGGWGMSNGVAAGHVLADLALGRENRWADAYASLRLAPLTRPRFWSGNAGAVRHLVADRLTAGDTEDVSELAPGDGVVVRRGRELVAVSRAESGVATAVSAVCTHLRCVVRWNRGEGSWDCPCHGSRFAPDGTVLHGPAVRPLPPRTI